MELNLKSPIIFFVAERLFRLQIHEGEPNLPGKEDAHKYTHPSRMPFRQGDSNRVRVRKSLLSRRCIRSS